MSKTEISLLLDEHIPASTAKELRNRDIDVEAVYETSLQGSSDEEILEHALSQDRVIVTQDTDFLEISEDAGIIFLTEPLEIGELTQQILKVVQELDREEILGSTVYIPWK